MMPVQLVPLGSSTFAKTEPPGLAEWAFHEMNVLLSLNCQYQSTEGNTKHWPQADKRSSDLAANSKPASERVQSERVQALADISRSTLYAFAVYKGISLRTCVLS